MENKLESKNIIRFVYNYLVIMVTILVNWISVFNNLVVKDKLINLKLIDVLLIR